MGIFEDQAVELADLLAIKFALITTAVLMVFAYNYAKGIAVWLALKMQGYREREEVYLNGTKAVITKLGFMTTTFLILNGGGPVMRWASVSNTSLSSQRIERISLRIGELEHEKREGK